MGLFFSAPRSFWASDSYVDSFIRGRARKAIKPNVNKRINNKYKSHKNRICESNEKIMRRNGAFIGLMGVVFGCQHNCESSRCYWRKGISQLPATSHATNVLKNLFNNATFRLAVRG